MNTNPDSRPDRSLDGIREIMRRLIRRRPRARTIVQSRFDTSDVLQESMIQVYEELAATQRKPSELPVSWLRKVVAGTEAKMVTFHRAKKRGANQVQNLPDQLEELDASPLEKLETQEDLGLLLDALQQLDLGTRQIIHRRIVLGESFAEIARQLRIAEHTARRTYRSAEHRLRSAVGRNRP